MKPFDERFADSVREVFDAYHEEVDPAALARLEQSLNRGAARFPGWMRMAAGLVLALGVLAVMGYYGLDWREGGAPGGGVASGVAGPNETVTSGAAPNGAVVPESTVSGGTASDGTVSSESVPNGAVVPESAVSGGDVGSSSVSGGTVPAGSAPDETVTNSTVTDAPPGSPDHVAQLFAAQDDSLDESLHPENDLTQNLHPVQADPQRDDAIAQGHRSVPTDTLRENIIAQNLHPATTDTLREAPAEADIPQNEYPLTEGPLRTALAAAPPESYETHELRSPGSASRNRASLVMGTNTTHTAQGGTDGIGFTAGALRHWQITRRISLSTGGLLAYNQFATANTDVDQQVSAIPSRAGEVNARITTETRYNLLAFEIPLQGVFEVYRQAGRGLSIAAGVSSMVYLNESSVAEGFRYGGEVLAGTEGSVWTNASVESYETRSTTGAFQRVDAGRLLNVSVMYAFRPGRNAIAIELFTKHPLGDLTSSDISFGMTGVTLRYGVW